VPLLYARPVDLPGRLHAGRRSRGRPANWSRIPPENLPRVDLLRISPPGAPRAPSLLRIDRLLRAARSRRDQRTPRWLPGDLLCRKVGRLSPQPWSRTRPTLLPPRRQLTGTCRKTCQVLLVARRLHLSLPVSAQTGLQSSSPESPTLVASSPGYGRGASTALPPK
jgi:hypothetical protein